MPVEYQQYDFISAKRGFSKFPKLKSPGWYRLSNPDELRFVFCTRCVSESCTDRLASPPAVYALSGCPEQWVREFKPEGIMNRMT